MIIGINEEVCKKTDCDYFRKYHNKEALYHCIKDHCRFGHTKYRSPRCPVPKTCPNKALHVISEKPVSGDGSCLGFFLCRVEE